MLVVFGTDCETTKAHENFMIFKLRDKARRRNLYCLWYFTRLPLQGYKELFNYLLRILALG